MVLKPQEFNICADQSDLHFKIHRDDTQGTENNKTSVTEDLFNTVTVRNSIHADRHITSFFFLDSGLPRLMSD